MATFPQGLTRIDKRCLEDDYIVWHDIPVGPKALQPGAPAAPVGHVTTRCPISFR